MNPNRAVIGADRLRPLRIFLSHTAELREHPPDRSFVRAAEAAVTRAGHTIVDMAYFAARNAPPPDYCVDKVAEADVYVGLIGLDYGTVVPSRPELSYVELEYEAATERGMPRLIFLVPESTSCLPTDRLSTESRRRQERFRRRLQDAGPTTAWISAPANLELELYQALVELDTPEATATAIRSLPRDVASFTGRQRDLDLLLAAVSPTEVPRIVAIDGMPGVGKTAFAIRAAHRIASEYPDGQLFLDLHAHTLGQAPVTPLQALEMLLLTTGLPPRAIPADVDARAALWRHRMVNRRVLVLLDDAAGHEQVEPLLPSGPGSVVLVTSRRRLSALPGAMPLTLDTLPPDHTAQLFDQLVGDRARDAGPAAVAELASLCGHLPLAIQLVAGRLRSHPAWNVRDLIATLRAAQDRLSHMQAEDVAVRGAFELSYRNLAADQQRLFRRLGLHPGPDFDTYAAAALEGCDPDTVGRELEALYSDHLIDEMLPGRYRMHDLIRSYALTLAREDDAESGRAAIDRVFDYYMRAAVIATRHVRRYASPETPPTAKPAPALPDLSTRQRALTWLTAERANLVTCLDHAAARASDTYVITLAHRIHSFLRLAGHWDQARAVAGTACSAARRVSNVRGQAYALTDLADVERLSGRYTEAGAALEEALAILDELGDRLGRANALTDLGSVRYATGDFRAATELLTRALALYQDLGDRLGRANALTTLGLVRYATSAYGAAAESLDEAVNIYRDIADPIGLANALNFLGAVRRVTGEPLTDEGPLAEAIALCRELGDRLGEANALGNLAIAQYSTGRYAQAIVSLREAVSLFEDLGSPGGMANALNELGTVQCRIGDYQAASASLTMAVSLFRELGVKLGEADALGNLGDLQRLTGAHAAAATSLNEALRIFRSLHDRRGEADVLTKLGEFRLACGASETAIELCRQARRLALDVAAPLEEARALECGGRALLKVGREEDGRRSLREALDIYRRLGAPQAEDVAAMLG